MSYVKVCDIAVNDNLIKVSFEYSIELKQYFLTNEFTCEYNFLREDIPYGIAVIPFVCNVLPIVWLTDSELILSELDEDFCRSIDLFKQGYIDMYPMLEFRGKTSVGEVKKYIPHNSGGSACFFSGGVDAFNTLFQHLDEHPALITVWGADVSLNDVRGWEIVRQHSQNTAEQLNLNFYTIKCNFHCFLNERILNKMIRSSGDGWWHGFQHGVGLIGLAAPLAYSLGKTTLYIASSYTEADKGTYTCASDPSIDNFVRFAGCHIVHDGYNFTRMDKVKNICRCAENGMEFRPTLRVCWIETGGKNCCKCEKCIRTMAELIVSGHDPHQYGFDYTDDDLKHSRRTVLSAFCRTIRPAWDEIQADAKKNSTDFPKGFKWINSCDIKRESRSLETILFKVRNKVLYLFKLISK